MSIDACALCEQEKASFTYISPRLDIFFANFMSLISSSLLKRIFSSIIIEPFEILSIFKFVSSLIGSLLNKTSFFNKNDNFSEIVIKEYSIGIIDSKSHVKLYKNDHKDSEDFQITVNGKYVEIEEVIDSFH